MAGARARWLGGVLASALPLGGCAVDGDDVGRLGLGLDAYCEAEVDGVGVLDVEGDYLPQVVACENGAAADEALAAQAVAARSFLYYKLAREGRIGDGQGDQVYTCGNPAGAQHRRAVEETSGLVLGYRGVVVAAFYVAGALQDPPACTGGAVDPTDTEVYVTYNEDRSGDDVEQTTLGLVDPANLENRGCQSQNGANCLAQAGRDYPSILRFYYGEDIELVRAEGPCVIGGDPPDPGDPDPPDPGDPEPSDPGDPDDMGEGPRLAGGGGCSASDGAASNEAAGGLIWLLALLPLVRARGALARSPSPAASRRRRG